MASLYTISEKLLDIFNNIESLDGEITEDLYNDLTLTQEALEEKLDEYVKAIKSWEADEKAVKTEKQQFNIRQNVLKNRIDRVKKAVVNALLQFGNDGKNNKFIELQNYRLSTRSINSVTIDEDRIDLLLRYVKSYIYEMNEIGVLDVNNIDLDGMLAAINANIIAEQDDEFQPFTMDDFMNLNVSISKTMPLKDLLFNGYLTGMYCNDNINVNIDPVLLKDYYKDLLANKNSNFTIIKPEKTTSLIIR